ncbi:MAG: COX15/CtaA family protein, partial [Thermoguttaceae bacterium]
MNRLAWGLGCLAFLLICSGGLVTANKAGMAVPDWPTTFGYWLSPPQHWLGPSLGAAANRAHRALALLTILGAVVVAAAAWRSGAHREVRALGVAAAAAAVVSTILGGWRVLADSIAAGWLHAAMAPVLLGACAALATVTSLPWQTAEPSPERRRAALFRRLCVAATVGVALLSLAGLPLRYVPQSAGLTWLPRWAWANTLLAVAALAVIGGLLLVARRFFVDVPRLVRRSGWLMALLAVQLLATAAAWVSNYGWPPWFIDSVFPIPYTVVAGGPLQVVAT